MNTELGIDMEIMKVPHSKWNGMEFKEERKEGEYYVGQYYTSVTIKNRRYLVKRNLDDTLGYICNKQSKQL